MTSNRSAALFALVLLAPALIYILVIVAYPLFDTVVLSFTNAALRPTYDFVGWANYERIFGAGNFTEVILRTFIWTFFSVATKMIIGTLGATLLNAAIPGQAVFRILTMPPWIVPMAIGIFMWGWMYNGQFGMISGMLQNFGVISKPWPILAYGDSAFWATIVTDVWIGVPMVTIYMLAAMQSIPKDLYEAAWTDGAGRFYRFRRITLPLISPTILLAMIVTVGGSLQVFAQIMVLTQGGPGMSTTVLVYYLYQQAFQFHRFGYGATISIVLFAIIVALTFAQWQMRRRIVFYER